jgi:FHA domain containing protein
MLSTAVPSSQALNTLQPVSQLPGVTALATLLESWRTYTSEGGSHKDVQGIATDSDGYFYVVTNDTLEGDAGSGTGFDFWSYLFPMLPPGQFADPVDVLLKVDPSKSRGIRQSIGVLSAPMQAPVQDAPIKRKGIFPKVHSVEPPAAPVAPPQPVTPEPTTAPQSTPSVPQSTPSVPQSTPSVPQSSGGVDVLRSMFDEPVPPVAPEPSPITPSAPTPQPESVPVQLESAHVQLESAHVQPKGIQSFTQSQDASEESPTGFLDNSSIQTVVLRNIVTNQTYRVTEIPQVAGRSSISSQLPISKDSSVSRRHCQIQLVNGKVVVTDLGSANGTYIGAKRLTPHQPTECPLRGVLRLGAVNLILEEN